MLSEEGRTKKLGVGPAVCGTKVKNDGFQFGRVERFEHSRAILRVEKVLNGLMIEDVRTVKEPAHLLLASERVEGIMLQC